MHEIIFHEQSSIQWLASPTCMLICLLNLSFMFSCIVNHLCFHLVSWCIHCHIFFQFPTCEFGQPWPRLYLHWDNIMKYGEERLCLPLQKCTFLPNHCPLGLFCAFMRDSDCWPRKLSNAVPEIAVTPSENCALRSSSGQQPNWIVHCKVLAVSHPPNCWVQYRVYKCINI